MRVKVCCIASVDEAKLAVSLGASALGLGSAMPSGPGVIDEALIAEIAASVPPAIGTFLLTSRTDAESIVRQQRRARVNTIQLCDRIEPSVLGTVSAELPGISLVQVIHVTGGESVAEAVATAPLVNGIFLDSGDPRLAVKELGGTGRVHDWSVSRRIRETVRVPLFLAGGLRPENVADAVAAVRPYALDVCTGVRTDGRLDREKLAAFIARARGAAA